MKKTKQMLEQENRDMRYALGRIEHYLQLRESGKPTEYGIKVCECFLAGAVKQITKNAIEKVGRA